MGLNARTLQSTIMITLMIKLKKFSHDFKTIRN